jgi:hypothetical protein
MISPTIEKAKESMESISETVIEPLNKIRFNPLKVFGCYAIIVFVLLISIKPSFILKQEVLIEDTEINYSKVILWQFIFMIPLFLYYYLN